MEINKLKEEVLKKIKPIEAELKKEKELSKEIIEKIENLEGKHVKTLLAGSLARETHLRGDRDLDIFVLFNHQLSRKEFEEEGLRIGKQVFRGHKWEKAYSEHPYIRGEIKGFKVEIVPSYQISSTEMLQSAVDRTPFHLEYVLNKLKTEQRDDVRLLKKFLKGIKCYGADIRVGSVPGYITELLVIKYGSFEKVIEAVSNWKEGEVIDLEQYYSEAEARKKFEDHLIVIDPIDKNRNVAAALSFNQYSRFIAATRAFLKRPSKKFFFGKKEKIWSIKKLRKMLEKKELVGIELGYPKGGLSDVMWGQLKRFRKKVMNELVGLEFEILRGDEWLEQEKLMVVLIELESRALQKTTKKFGPKITMKEHSEKFLQVHKRKIAGPRIEDGRWVIEVLRKYTTVEKALDDYLKKERKISKENIRKALNKKARVLHEKDLIQLFKKNKEFAKYFSSYLKGEEEFLTY